MNKYKKEIMAHYVHSIEFVNSLNSLNEKEWRMRIGNGQWTVAEIIGHFLPWDEFMLQHRIPHFFSEQILPKGPDINVTNQSAASIARKESQQEIINKFISVRAAFYQAIEEISDEQWEKNISIGKTTISLYDYFKGLIEHDNHHFNQITKLLH